MFSADSVTKYIKVEDIYSKISEYDIFKRYCPHFKELDVAFLSEFYDDKSPDCYVSQDKNNNLFYKDFGQADHRFSCLYYVMYKYQCTYKEVLSIISNDFNLSSISNDIQPRFLLGKDLNTNIIKPKQRSIITIYPRNWDLTDYRYWQICHLDFNRLDDEDVIPTKYVYLEKNGKTIIFNSTKSNPIYSYKEFDWETNKFLGWKVYFPLSPNKKFKWMCCADISRSYPGFNKLPEKGKLLIVTKSRKDVLVLNLLGFNAISIPSETSNLSEELINNIKLRFTTIILLLDSDKTGIESSEKLSSKYDLKSIIIPAEYNCTDTAEIVNKIGLNKSKILINKLINDKTGS